MPEIINTDERKLQALKEVKKDFKDTPEINEAGETRAKIDRTRKVLKDYTKKTDSPEIDPEKDRALKMAIGKVADDYVTKNFQGITGPEKILKVAQVITELTALIDGPQDPPQAAQPARSNAEVTQENPEDKIAAKALFETFTKPTTGLMTAKNPEATTKLQEVLVKLGYENQLKKTGTEAVDGQYGKATHDAVEDLQIKINATLKENDKKLVTDGNFGPATHDALAKYLGVPSSASAPEPAVTPAAKEKGQNVVPAPGTPENPQNAVSAPAVETVKAVAPLELPKKLDKKALDTSIDDISKRNIIWESASFPELKLGLPEGKKEIATLLAVKYPSVNTFIIEYGDQSPAPHTNTTRELLITIKTNPKGENHDTVDQLHTSFIDSADPAQREKNLKNALRKILATGEQEPADKRKLAEPSPQVTEMIRGNRSRKLPEAQRLEEGRGALQAMIEATSTDPAIRDKYTKSRDKLVEEATAKITNNVQISKEKVDDNEDDAATITEITKTLSLSAQSALEIKLPNSCLEGKGMKKIATEVLKTSRKMRENFPDTDDKTVTKIDVPITTTDQANILKAFIEDNKEIIEKVAFYKTKVDGDLDEAERKIQADKIDGVKVNSTSRQITIDGGYKLSKVGAESESAYISGIDLNDFSTDTITQFKIEKTGDNNVLKIWKQPTDKLASYDPKMDTSEPTISYVIAKLPEGFANADKSFLDSADKFLPESYKGTTLEMTNDEANDITIKQPGGTDKIILDPGGNNKTKEMRWESGNLASFITDEKVLKAMGIDNPNQPVSVLNWQTKWRGTAGKNVDGKVIFTDKGIISITNEGRFSFVPKKSADSGKPDSSKPDVEKQNMLTYQTVDLRFQNGEIHPGIIEASYKGMPEIIDNDEGAKTLVPKLATDAQKAIGVKLPNLDGPKLNEVAKQIDEITKAVDKKILLTNDTKKTIIAALIEDNIQLFNAIETNKADFDKKLTTAKEENKKVDGLNIDQEKRSITVDPGLYKGNPNTLDFNDYSNGTIPKEIRISSPAGDSNQFTIEISRTAPDGSNPTKESITFKKLSEQEKSVDKTKTVLDNAGFALGTPDQTESGKYTIKEKGGKEIPGVSIKVNAGKAFITGEVGGGTVPLDINEKLGQEISKKILENELKFAIKPELPKEVLADKETIKTLTPNKDNKETSGKNGYSYIKTEQGDILFKATADKQWTSMKTGDKFNKSAEAGNTSLERNDITEAKNTFKKAGYELVAPNATETAFTLKEIPGIKVTFTEGKVTIAGTQEPATTLETKGLTPEKLTPVINKIQVENEIGIKINDTVSPTIIEKLLSDKAVIASEVFNPGAKLDKGTPSGYQYRKTKEGAIFVRTDSGKNEWISLATGKLNSRDKVKGVLTFVPIKEVEAPAKTAAIAGETKDKKIPDGEARTQQVPEGTANGAERKEKLVDKLTGRVTDDCKTDTYPEETYLIGLTKKQRVSLGLPETQKKDTPSYVMINIDGNPTPVKARVVTGKKENIDSTPAKFSGRGLPRNKDITINKPKSA